MDKNSQPRATMADAKEYTQAIAEKYNIFPKLSDADIHKKAEEDIENCMTRACENTSTVDQAREYEKQAQDIARMCNLPIPELSYAKIRTKAKEEMDNCMINARQYTCTVDRARIYEMQAKLLARTYNFPTPELSDDEIRSKAEEEIDDCRMYASQYSTTIDKARYYEKRAQDVARTYGLPIFHLSDIDIEAIRQRETEDRK
jgi:hypothetical protein